jgi:predicted  nucleic acid-binding Zn ribbon protein
MRHEVQKRLAQALQIPVEYLQAAGKGEVVEIEQSSNVCPSCWTPGSSPDIRWSMVDAKFCTRCGTKFINKCVCGTTILLTAKFCPECGKNYKNL